MKSCNFNIQILIQILIQSKKVNLNDHIKKLEKNKNKENNNLKNIINKYQENIIKINSINKSDSKQFFIIISEKIENKKEEIIIQELNEKYFKIKDGLSRCGNKIININKKEEIEKILKKSLFIET